MKCFKNSITNNEHEIDYDRKTPYKFEAFETIKGIKYKIICTVRKGVADSRVIDYEIEKIGD